MLRILAVNNEKLIDLLDTDDDLIGKMSSADCFTVKQLNCFRNTSELNGRNRKVLDMLTRRSIDQFNKFVECVHATQPHIVPLLTGNSGYYTPLQLLSHL